MTWLQGPDDQRDPTSTPLGDLMARSQVRAGHGTDEAGTWLLVLTGSIEVDGITLHPFDAVTVTSEEGARWRSDGANVVVVVDGIRRTR